jgi:hypothetical protein
MLIGHEGWMTVSYRVIGERSKRVSNTIPRDAARLVSPRDAIKCRRISSGSTDQAGLSVKRGTSSDSVPMHMHRHDLCLSRSPSSLTWGYDRLLICGGRRSARLCSHIVTLLRMRVAIGDAFVSSFFLGIRWRRCSRGGVDLDTSTAASTPLKPALEGGNVRLFGSGRSTTGRVSGQLTMSMRLIDIMCDQ